MRSTRKSRKKVTKSVRKPRKNVIKSVRKSRKKVTKSVRKSRKSVTRKKVAEYFDEYVPIIDESKIDKNYMKLLRSANIDKKEFLYNYISGVEIPKYLEKILHKPISVDKKIKWSVIMHYCTGRIFTKNSNLQTIGYHATSNENFNKIEKGGFDNFSLFTHTNIMQSIQVGKRYGDDYVIVLCLFNVNNVISNDEADELYRPKIKRESNRKEEWEVFKNNLHNNNIDATYQPNQDSILISDKRNIIIFGYITNMNGKFQIYMY